MMPKACFGIIISFLQYVAIRRYDYLYTSILSIAI